MKIKKSNLLIAILFLITITSMAFADSPTRPSDDPFGPNFFSPELVMNHQSDIALKDSQRQTIIDEIKKTQSNLIEVQFKMKAATQDLVSILSTTKVDEAKAIAALQKLTKIEEEMKTMHVTIMIRIKNTLTKEQQEKLRTFGK